MSDAALALSRDDNERRLGFLAAAGAYVFWGVFPLYLHLLSFADVREVLGQRILWGVPSAFAAILLMSGWRKGWSEVAEALKPRMLATLAASACFIFVNWGLYVWLVLSHRVIESALAYFLAPLVAVAAGVVFFRERVSAAQVAALALAALGIVVQGLALGAPPWMALALCATWSIYAIIRKRAAVPAAVGLLIETLALAPVCIGLLMWAAHDAPLAFTTSTEHAVLLALAGPATAIPLVAFTYGARRISFTTIGLLQFLAPTLQFATGIAFGEQFTLLRGVSFALIWIGLGLFSLGYHPARTDSMIYYAIGDVHGEKAKLDDLLAQIAADAGGALHTIVFIGDLIDRGADSRGVVEKAMQLTLAGRAITIRGNHEELLLYAFDHDETAGLYHWANNGGDQTIASYMRPGQELEDWKNVIDPAHIKWLRTLPVMHRDEARSLVFVHGGIDPWRFPNESDEVRLWTRSPTFFRSNDWPDREEVRNILVVHGHTPTPDFEPDQQRRRINIDTGACFGGPLTSVVLTPDQAPRFLRSA